MNLHEREERERGPHPNALPKRERGLFVELPERARGLVLVWEKRRERLIDCQNRLAAASHSPSPVPHLPPPAPVSNSGAEFLGDPFEGGAAIVGVEVDLQ